MSWFAALLPLMIWDLTVEDGGLLESGGTKQWEWGVASAGPVGTTCWGTVLDGLYLNDSVDRLALPPLELEGASRPVLVFEHWIHTLNGDHGYIEVDSGTGFQRVEPVYGYPFPGGFAGSPSGWRTDAVDLVGLGASPRVRFVFSSNPALAADGWYIRHIALYDGDPIPPRLSLLSVPDDTQDLVGPHVVVVDVEDDQPAVDLTLGYRANGGTEQQLTRSGVSGLVSFEIPSVPPDTVVTWGVTAEDGSNSSEVEGSPFRVFLAAPREFSGPQNSRLVATEVELGWEVPDSPHVPLRYRVRGVDDAGPWDTEDLFLTVPVGAAPQQFTVSAVYAAGEGDQSDVLSLEVEVPKLDGVVPGAVFPGEHRYVEVLGQSLYLLDGVSTAHLGEGVHVHSLDVVDVGRAVLLVEVAEDAVPGLRDLQVVGTQGSFLFPEAFEVEAGDPASIASIDPARITQGETETFRVVATEPFGEVVSVDAGDDLVLLGEPQVDGTLLIFELIAYNDAPVGPRTLILDDGERLYTVDIEVREYLVPPQRVCSTSPQGGLWLIGLLLAIRTRERRSA